MDTNTTNMLNDFINELQSTITDNLKNLWCESFKVVAEIHKQKYGYNYLLVKVDDNKIASLSFNFYKFHSNKESIKNDILNIIFGDEVIEKHFQKNKKLL